MIEQKIRGYVDSIYVILTTFVLTAFVCMVCYLPSYQENIAYRANVEALTASLDMKRLAPLPLVEKKAAKVKEAKDSHPTPKHKPDYIAMLIKNSK